MGNIQHPGWPSFMAGYDHQWLLSNSHSSDVHRIVGVVPQIPSRLPALARGLA